MYLGKIIKSNSHWDYVVELADQMEVMHPPDPDRFGFGSFVKLEGDRHWAVGVIYNSIIHNPNFASRGPRLSSDPDPFFTPDLITETRTLLGVVLIGSFLGTGQEAYGEHRIPQVIVPVNTQVSVMEWNEIKRFHVNSAGDVAFSYYPHLLKAGGQFATAVAEQILNDLIGSEMFDTNQVKAMKILAKNLAWKNTLSAMM